MIVAESRRGRRLVGRLDRGAELLTALADLCAARGVRCAEIRAFGTVEEIDLREFDQRTRAFRAVRRFTTPFQLVHFSANLAERDGHAHVEAQAAVAREGDNGIEVVAGAVVRARVYAVDFVIDAFDDVLLRRAIDAGTGLPLYAHAVEAPRAAEPAPAAVEARAEAVAGVTPVEAEAHGPVPLEAPPRGYVGGAVQPEAVEEPSWAEVAAISAAVSEPGGEPAPEEPLRAGDVIEHVRFGRVQVERIEGDSEFAQVRLRNGRTVRLSLDVLQLVRAGMDGSRRLWRAITPR